MYIKKEFARELRKEQTLTEQLVWKALRDRKYQYYKFRRQHIIKGYVVDFYCHKLRLAIEIDGKIHENQEDYDEMRQAEIEFQGIKFIRIDTRDIYKNINILLTKIDTVIQSAGVRALVLFYTLVTAAYFNINFLDSPLNLM
ncbi:DUF559 domain-containing protein [bacterium]|nr:DUF559 domain-containing protein [bacterium]MBT5988209.1 DUF559 domain-containing protein [bacterium]